MKTLRDRAAGEINRGAGFAGSVLLHVGAVLSFVLAGREAARVSPLPAYRVELVAAPRATGDETAGSVQPAAASERLASAASRQPPAASHQPSATSHQPPPASRPATRAPARPAASRQPPAASHQTAATSAQPPVTSPQPGPPVASPNTSAAPGTGTDAATIRTEGVEFPFPVYLRNLVAQVYRRWRPPGGNADLEAEMLFFVHRDGSITGLQFVRRSGSFAFDLEAQGAVEAAARAGAFGVLPGGFGPDLLPVSFFFSPRSLR